MTNFNALLFGYSYALLAAPASLLVRAGFKVDLICPHHQHVKTSQWVDISAPKNLLVSKAIELLGSKNYHLVIVGDDYCMADVIDSNLPIEIKLKLLPVVSSANLDHLFSKCMLSKILLAAGIATPDFEICRSLSDLKEGAKKIGFPLFIKVDRSGGGCGVFECANNKDLLEKSTNLSYPLLLQKKIEGRIVDMTAFYQNGRLIDFSYSVFYKTVGGPFGASSVRRYTQVAYLPKEIFMELERLGFALGAHGFANITCMEDRITGQRYFIEADMRPNVWVDHARYIGNDPAKTISQYFAEGQLLSMPQVLNPLYPRSKLVSYADRLTLIDLILNRYECWGSFDSRKHALKYILARAGYRQNIIKKCFKSGIYQLDLILRVMCSRHIKPYIPQSIWHSARTQYRRFFHR